MFQSMFLASAILLFAAFAQAADPAISCRSGKLKVAGKYASCRLGADAKGVKTGDPADYSKCTSTFDTKWAVAESKGEGMCPGGDMDGTPISGFINACDTAVADALAGGPLLIDVITCNADLAVCEAEPEAQPVETGQLSCFTAGGAVTPCAGTDQDGDLLKGVPRSFTDNGDGTVTDTATGLMWEKLSDDGTINDKDTSFTWADAFAVKIAGLNSAVFAGHSDWRLPNVNELHTLLNFEASFPAAWPPFDTTCAATCTVLSCSCTRDNEYWTSTTDQDTPASAWVIFFGDGNQLAEPKANVNSVRGVRGGPQ